MTTSPKTQDKRAIRLVISYELLQEIVETLFYQGLERELSPEILRGGKLYYTAADRERDAIVLNFRDGENMPIVPEGATIPEVILHYDRLRNALGIQKLHQVITDELDLAYRRQFVK